MFGHQKILDNKKIIIKNLTFQYHENFKAALNNISFEIERGEYVVFVGHNGCGKSTLAKILAGVLPLQKGSVSIFGNQINEKNKRQLKQKVGIIFDNPDYQLIGSTVKEDIIFGLENFNVEVSKMDQIVDDVLTKVNMQEHKNSSPIHLSGGQKQKAALATILANQPELVIFDEALSMLDSQGKKQISEIIHVLRKRLQQTIISITHDMEEIKLADRVIVFNDAQIVSITNYEELIEKPLFLKENHLSLPFSCELSHALIQAQIPLKSCNHNHQSLIEELCSIMK